MKPIFITSGELNVCQTNIYIIANVSKFWGLPMNSDKYVLYCFILKEIQYPGIDLTSLENILITVQCTLLSQ